MVVGTKMAKIELEVMGQKRKNYRRNLFGSWKGDPRALHSRVCSLCCGHCLTCGVRCSLSPGSSCMLSACEAMVFQRVY